MNRFYDLDTLPQRAIDMKIFVLLIIAESVNIEGILAQQRLAWTALEQKRAELQIALSSK